MILDSKFHKSNKLSAEKLDVMKAQINLLDKRISKMETTKRAGILNSKQLISTPLFTKQEDSHRKRTKENLDLIHN